MGPIVLHHGLLYGDFGVGKFRQNSFKGIDTALEAAGYPVFVSHVHPTAGIEKRARQLKQWLISMRPQWKGQKILLLAHSLGGLDARYMLSELGMADVATLVTISTPHRGSPYADWLVENLGRKLGGIKLMKKLGIDFQAAEDLTTEKCAAFNKTVADVKGVSYYSVSASRPLGQIPAVALHSWSVVYRKEGRNDGMVSVRSARWGKHLVTWRSDHWHEINRFFGLASRRDGDVSPKYLALVKNIGWN